MDLNAVAALVNALRQGPVPVTQYQLEEQDLEGLGLSVEGGNISLPANLALLDPTAIKAGLESQAASWFRHLHHFDAIGSTNTWMMQRASHGSIAGLAALAECQLAGRGRRGRSWASPVAANLAMSLGFALPGTLSQLSGLSLAIGVAAVEALDPQGELSLQLKWPNDVLVAGRKLAGILVEVTVVDAVPQVCVGVGVNWQVPMAVRSGIDQPIVDMAELNPSLNRSAGAARLISRIVDYVNLFAKQGLAPLLSVFDGLHRFQGKRCTIIRPQGNVRGEVLGVNAAGELQLRTANGVEVFGSGEVSLREDE